ncbi:MAG: DUF2752 domain-containing protein [Bacteroidales bacterium]|nr:DUF2752 domain-containing protein [Bacteroidales bacterium]MBN2821255.1 DUF2752 domain-containing protein [Bacteroidales bacterium]
MTQEQKNYKLINLILAGVFVSIFTYSGFFAYTGINPILPSFNKIIIGEDSISTGLTRCFMAIMEFDFSSARQYNPYGIKVFLFFAFQLIMRVVLNQIIKANRLNMKAIVYSDIIISTGLFIFCFWPFIKATLG